MRRSFVVWAVAVVIVFCNEGQDQDCTRSSIFSSPRQGHKLEGCVFKEQMTASEMECLMTCSSDVKCLSVNVVEAANGRFICQLNNKTATGPLAEQDGAWYFERQADGGAVKVFLDGCKVNSCGGCARCTDYKRHQNHCPSGYFGPQCRKAGGISLPGEIDKYTYIDKSVGPLPSLTLSIWFKMGQNATDTNKMMTLYSQIQSPTKIYVNIGYGKRTALGFEMFGDIFPPRWILGPDISSDRWHHVIVVWDSSTGSTQVYYDGVVKANGTFAKSAFLNGTSVFVLGQRVKSISPVTLGPNYVPFEGSLHNLNLWNRPLTDQELRNLYMYPCHNLSGNVISWTELISAAARTNQLKFTSRC